MAFHPAASLFLIAILAPPLWATGSKKTENGNPSGSGVLSASGAEKDYLGLKEDPDPEDAPVFLGLGVSLGSGRRVAARVTFDRTKAAAGGWVYASETSSYRDGGAVKMSEAVLTGGGPLGFAAVAARRHSVPALLVSGMRWGGPDDPSLTFESAVFGPVVPVRGFPVRLARKTETRVIKEGDVVVVDPLAGTLRAPGPELGKLYVEAFAALRAYDGLKDGQALAQWVDGQAGELSPTLRLELGRLLIGEMAERSRGSAGVKDLAKVRAALERMAGQEGLKALRAAERKVLARQVRSSLAFFDESLAGLGTASSAWADRVCRESEGRWQRLDLLAAEFKLADPGSARASFRRLQGACGRKRLKDSGPGARSEGLDAMLESAGIRSPRKARVPAELYRRFLVETGLEPRIETLSGDISQPLARRSERIRALIRAANIPDTLAREVSACLPSSGSWVFLVPGVGARVLKPGEVEPVKEHWAALWSPGRLAQRRRESRPVKDSEAEVELILLDPCLSSAVVLSRDPASGKPRMSVAAAYGELEGVLSGRASPDQYTLGPDGREVLPALIGVKNKRVLSSEQLSRLAAAARILEGHYGWGVEVSACFSDEGLTVLGSVPIDRLLTNDL